MNAAQPPESLAMLPERGAMRSATSPASPTPPAHNVLTLGKIDLADVETLLARYGLRFQRIADGAAIPGSYWGEREAGLIGNTVFARHDTPVHSLLHEAGHLIVMPSERREAVHTDASDSIEEEDAVCVLQVLLADALPGVGRERILADMDAWGYTFRLGSARAYLEHDAETAWGWLAAHGLIDPDTRALTLPENTATTRRPPFAARAHVMTPLLYIGNKNYSSWSLRPWLCLRWAGIAFEERLVRLDQPGYGKQQIAEVTAVSPSGTVPALLADGVAIWDSLAIAEWAAEQVAPGVLWPQDASLRAQARAATCEMHSGFSALRRDLSMNLHRRCETMPDFPEDTHANLRRIESLWTTMRERHGHLGPYLFGTRSIADAFFTPVATRFRTYAAPLSGAALAYRDLLLDDADFRAWEADSIPNSWDASGYSVIDKLHD